MSREFWFTDRLHLEEGLGRFVDLRPRQNDRLILKNPHKGWYWHYVEGGFDNAHYRQGYERIEDNGTLTILDDVSDFPGLNHLYLRFNWGDIEREQGVYDWTPIDRVMEAWSKYGYRFALRGCTFMGNLSYATPQYVLDLGAKTKPYHIDRMDTREPIYDDPIYLERLAAFMRAYGEKFNGHPLIEYVDMGTFGTWGEASASTLYPTSVIRKHIDLHLSAFPDTHIMINDDFFAGRSGREIEPGETQELLDYARAHGMTLRDDSICYTPYVDIGNYHSLLVPSVYDALYENGPIDTEFCHAYYYEREKCADGESAFEDGFRALSALERGRVTYAGFHNHPREFMRLHGGMARYGANRLGYWYFPEGAQIPIWRAGERAEMTLYLSNRGYAKCSYRFDVKLRLAPKAGGAAYVLPCAGVDNRLWTPTGAACWDHLRRETLAVSLAGVPAGTYEVQFGLFEKETPIALGLMPDTRRGDWYALADADVR